MKRRRKILFFAACGLTAIVAVCFFCLRQNEPSYNGRTLSEWCAMYGDERNSFEKRENARTAITSIGTNAIPWLLRWVNYYPSSASLRVWHKMPDRLKMMPTIMNHFANAGPQMYRAEV